jgi:hypothetical protein
MILLREGKTFAMGRHFAGLRCRNRLTVNSIMPFGNSRH